MTNSLLRLLRARDAAAVDQGVELAVALGEASLFDDLLDGIEYGSFANPRRFHDRDPRWIIVPNTLFTGSRAAQPYLDRAVLGLVAHAPAGTRAAALREQVQELWIGGPETEDAPLDLGWFRDFHRLESLEIHHQRPLRNLEGLANLGALKRLVLHACRLADGFSGFTSGSLEELVVLGVGLTGLQGLQGASALRVLRLHGEGVCDLSAVEGLSGLEALGISGFHLPDLPNFSLLPNLEELSLQGVTSHPPRLRELPKLQSLILIDLAMPDLSGLEQLPALQHLRVSLGPQQPGLSSLNFQADPGLPSLEHVELEADELSNLEGIEKLPALRSLDIRSHGPLELGTLHATSLRSLSLSSPRLSGIDVLPEALEELSICAPNLLQLPPLPAGLRRLFLPGCASLTEVDLLGCPGLEQLSLDGCSQIQQVTATGSLLSLRTLDLRETRSIRLIPELSNLPELRAVAIDGCALARHNFPLSIRQLLTSDPRVDLDALFDQPAPQRPSRQRDDSAFQTLLKRLRIRDNGAVDAAVADLADSLEGAPERWEWFDRLLAGSKVIRQVSSWSHREMECLEPGLMLKGNRSEAPYRDHAVRALVAAAPPGSVEARRLRLEVTRLRVSGHMTLRRDPDAAVNIATLRAFPHLHTLSVECARPLNGQEALAGMPLSSLELAGCTGVEVLPPLPSGLRHLRLESLVGLRDLVGLESNAQMEDMELDRIEIGDMRFLACLPRLRRLRLRHLPNVHSLDGLAACVHLEELELTALPMVDLAPLARLPRLRRLHLESCAHLIDLQALISLPLTHLTLEQLFQLKDLRPLTRIPTLQTVRSDGVHGALPTGYRWSEGA